MVTVSWRACDGSVHEITAPEPCFHRVALGMMGRHLH
jgi:hypothetical protein